MFLYYWSFFKTNPQRTLLVLGSLVAFSLIFYIPYDRLFPCIEKFQIKSALNALKGDNREKRQKAVKSLELLTGMDFGDDYAKWLNWLDP
jgi:hypothetical protein